VNSAEIHTNLLIGSKFVGGEAVIQTHNRIRKKYVNFTVSMQIVDIDSRFIELSISAVNKTRVPHETTIIKPTTRLHTCKVCVT
jgi:hypothetical protein